MSPEPDLDRLLAEDSFDGLVFTGLDLQGLEIGKREFVGCTFRDCKAQESRWRGARLDGCRFERCDLTRMQPNGMRAHEVDYRESKLMGVEWTDLGQFPQLAFHDCVLDFASFVGLGLRKTGFIACKIGEANFLDADLRAADFARSDLRGSLFRGCQLAGTDFSAATGVFLDPAINAARGAVVPIETAALLAMHLGLQVAGFSASASAAARPVKPAKRRR